MQSVYVDKCVNVSKVRHLVQQFNWDVGGHKFVWQSKDRKARTVFKNLLNVGKSVLKQEKIMWKSDYAQL